MLASTPPARADATAPARLRRRLARIARPDRRAVVEEAGQDAHVVVGEIAEDEIRRHAAAGPEARAVRIGAAPLGGSAVDVGAAAAEFLEDRLPGRDARRLLAAEAHRRAQPVLVVAGVVELLALLDDDRR